MPAPPTIAGLHLDLDPSTLGLADGDAVPSWADSSPAAHAALVQATTGLQPTYRAAGVNGLPSVHFDGTGRRLDAGDGTSTLVDSAGFTGFWICQLDDATADAVSIGRLSVTAGGSLTGGYRQFSLAMGMPGNSGLSGYGCYFGFSVGNVIVSGDVPGNPTGPYTSSLTGPSLVAVAWDGVEPYDYNSFCLWVNGEGVPLSHGGSYPVTVNSTGLGAQFDGTWPMNGLVGRERVYGRKLALAELKAELAWAAATFGVAVPTLPRATWAGNSLAMGYLSSGPSATPSAVLQSLQGGSGAWDMVNVAVGGQTTEAMATDFVQTTIARYGPTRGRNVLILWEGTNSLNQGDTPAQAYAAMAARVAQAKSWATDWEVYVGTTTPSTYSSLRAGWDADRLSYNALLRSNAASAGYKVIDFAAVAQFSDPTNTTYFNADQLHLSDAGYAVAAATALAALAPPSVLFRRHPSSSFRAGSRGVA